jgi:Transglycosylase SLT domain
VKTIAAIDAARRAFGRSLGVFLRDVGHGALELCHNSLALVGLLVVGVTLFVAGQADLRRQAETVALGWLQDRELARAEASGDLLAAVEEPDAVARATAADPAALSREQANVTRWLARRYKVAPEPLSRLVQEAWHIGERARLDPTLILAIMAIESSFNPFAQSPVGAQGLMQVMTRVHDDKYEPFGGVHAAFDPVTNLRVGVQVLKECIQRAGSLEAGLRFYVGAAISGQDGGYVARVLFEQSHLQRVARGQMVAVTVPSSPPSTQASDQPVMPAEAASAPEANESPDDQKVALLRR